MTSTTPCFILLSEYLRNYLIERGCRVLQQNTLVYWCVAHYP